MSVQPPVPNLLKFDIAVDAKDADQASEYISYNINPVEVRPLQRGVSVKVNGSFGFANGMAIWRAGWPYGADLKPLSEFDGYFCYMPLRGVLTADMHHDVLASDDQKAMVGDGAEFKSLRFYAGRTDMGFCIERGLLVRRLSRLLDKPLKTKLVFQPDVSITTGPGAALFGYVQYLSNSAFGSGLNAMPLAAEAVSSTLVDMALEALPHNYTVQLHKTPALVAPRHVKRAIDYIMSHLASSITIDQLADLSGASIRSLQYGFQRFVGMSPKDFILNQRLAAARRDLESGRASISDVATYWGFTNISRFNTHFRAKFGDSPRDVRSTFAVRRREAAAKLSTGPSSTESGLG